MKHMDCEQRRLVSRRALLGCAAAASVAGPVGLIPPPTQATSDLVRAAARVLALQSEFLVTVEAVRVAYRRPNNSSRIVGGVLASDGNFAPAAGACISLAENAYTDALTALEGAVDALASMPLEAIGDAPILALIVLALMHDVGLPSDTPAERLASSLLRQLAAFAPAEAHHA